MHHPFLSCCKLWYGTNGICYDFVQRETWHLEFYFQKNAKMKSSSMIAFPTKAIWHYTKYKTLVICCLVSHWALSNYLWPLLRFSSCTHDQDSHTPTNKMLTLTRRVTTKTCFSIHQINTPLIFFMSLSKKFICQKKVWAMLKNKKKERQYPC